jgi:hypothetical protein
MQRSSSSCFFLSSISVSTSMSPAPNNPSETGLVVLELELAAAQAAATVAMNIYARGPAWAAEWLLCTTTPCRSLVCVSCWHACAALLNTMYKLPGGLQSAACCRLHLHLGSDKLSWGESGATFCSKIPGFSGSCEVTIYSLHNVGGVPLSRLPLHGFCQ